MLAFSWYCLIQSKFTVENIIKDEIHFQVVGGG